MNSVQRNNNILTLVSKEKSASIIPTDDSGILISNDLYYYYVFKYVILIFEQRLSPRSVAYNVWIYTILRPKLAYKPIVLRNNYVFRKNTLYNNKIK